MLKFTCRVRLLLRVSKTKKPWTPTQNVQRLRGREKCDGALSLGYSISIYYTIKIILVKSCQPGNSGWCKIALARHCERSEAISNGTLGIASSAKTPSRNDALSRWSAVNGLCTNRDQETTAFA